ncbi:MAG: hypothetical protein ACRDTE_12035 [Pseudonocardiaceae bacterium]
MPATTGYAPGFVACRQPSPTGPGRLEESLHYAQLGAEAAARSRGTAGVWLASAEARALAALNRLEEAHAALNRATDLRDHVQPDELDTLGGTCTFSRPRQLYFAAEALSWGGQPEATRAERSPSTPWTPMQQHRPRTGPSATKPIPASPWPLPGSLIARSTAGGRPSSRCWNFPQPSAPTAS